MNNQNVGVRAHLDELKRSGDVNLLEGWAFQLSESFLQACDAEIAQLVSGALEYQLTEAGDMQGPWAVFSNMEGDIEFFMHLDQDTRPVFTFNIVDLVEYEIEGNANFEGKADQGILDKFENLAAVFEKAAKRLRSISLCEPDS